MALAAAKVESPSMTDRHWILFDGDCGMCGRFARGVARKDVEGQFEIVPFQEAPSPPMTPELARACERALHVVLADGKVLRAGRAVLFVKEQLGWGWFARLLRRAPFIWFIEIGYRLVADHRPFFSRFVFRR
jgi:predicted DCC family thiol-disulfide oxidoreductase YuxK